MTRFGRFARLGPDERRLVLSAIACLGVVQTALAVLPWRLATVVIARARRACPSTCRPAPRIVWAVHAASGVLPRTTCLARALTLQALLASAGLAATIEVGVARDAGGALVAHAWVERDGVPLLDTAEGVAGYTRVPGERLMNLAVAGRSAGGPSD
jgi:hypothetical protein